MSSSCKIFQGKQVVQEQVNTNSTAGHCSCWHLCIVFTFLCSVVGCTNLDRQYRTGFLWFSTYRMSARTFKRPLNGLEKNCLTEKRTLKCYFSWSFIFLCGQKVEKCVTASENKNNLGWSLRILADYLSSIPSRDTPALERCCLLLSLGWTESKQKHVYSDIPH